MWMTHATTSQTSRGKLSRRGGGGFQVTDFIHATTAFMAKRVRLLSKLRVANQDCELKIWAVRNVFSRQLHISWQMTLCQRQKRVWWEQELNLFWSRHCPFTATKAGFGKGQCQCHFEKHLEKQFSEIIFHFWLGPLENDHQQYRNKRSKYHKVYNMG